MPVPSGQLSYPASGSAPLTTIASDRKGLQLPTKPGTWTRRICAKKRGAGLCRSPYGSSSAQGDCLVWDGKGRVTRKAFHLLWVLSVDRNFTSELKKNKSKKKQVRDREQRQGSHTQRYTHTCTNSVVLWCLLALSPKEMNFKFPIEKILPVKPELQPLNRSNKRRLFVPRKIKSLLLAKEALSPPESRLSSMAPSCSLPSPRMLNFFSSLPPSERLCSLDLGWHSYRIETGNEGYLVLRQLWTFTQEETTLFPISGKETGGFQPFLHHPSIFVHSPT